MISTRISLMVDALSTELALSSFFFYSSISILISTNRDEASFDKMHLLFGDLLFALKNLIRHFENFQV